MTKRADQLLQKANVYEKLALFGSRKNFLSAIAQEVRLVFPPANLVEALKPVEAKLQSVVRQVGDQAAQSGPDLANLQAALNGLGNLMQSAYVTTLADLKGKADALATQLMNVRTGAYGLARSPALQPELKSYLTQLSGEASAAYDLMMKDPNVAQVMGQTPDATPVAQQTAPAAQKATVASIPKDVQEKLSEMLSVRGDYFPFAVGDHAKAQKALDIFKKNYNSSQFTGEALYNEVRKSYNIWQMNERANTPPAPTNPFSNR